MIAQVVKESIKWIEMQDRKDNLFLWMDAFDPHEPWDPMPPFDTMYLDPGYKGTLITQPIPGRTKDYLNEDEIKCVRSLYAGKVSQCDKWVGVLLDFLKAQNLMDNTLIILNSDHGEPLGEHGYMRKAFPTPYIEETQVPLLIRHPEKTGAGKSFDAFVNTPDLMPTILDFLKVKGPRMHGQSLLPIMKGEKTSIRDFAISGYYNKSWKIMDKKWAFTKYLAKGYEDELFNRVKDRAEMHNVIADHPEIRDALELKLRRFMASLR
jgi:arylsulfatase A-like enzyme